MTSKSKTAQERLTSLEKASAPFEEQLVEAEKFIGITISSLNQPPSQEKRVGVYHGREEWLLRWILKKLGEKKDVAPRSKPESWLLLGWLVQTVPRISAARLLVERKFAGILKGTLEEVRKSDAIETKSEDVAEDPAKNSKKRKRTPVTTSKSGSQEGVLQLLEAIHSVLSFITSSAEDFDGEEEGRDIAFTAEYMRTTIRTSAEEAAILLGLWMSLSPLVSKSNNTSETWLSPFIEIWQARAAGDHDLMLFSLHCTKPLVQLLQDSRWRGDLEQLAARNILIPARLDMTRNPESQLLSTLTKISVIQDPGNAPIFFDIAIRSIHTHGSGRRKPQDDLWLQTVFNTLQEGFVKTRHVQNCKALQEMLQSATKFKVKLDLPTLREVASQYALPEDDTNWELVAGLLRLDGNVFLIPEPESDLLQRLLSVVTKLPFSESEYAWSENIASDVMIPLMNEFAKARDLDGFIRHWYEELRKFTALWYDEVPAAVKLFCPWEQAALQDGLAKLLESSLTLHQISQTIDWLEVEVKTKATIGEYSIDLGRIDSASVILQAISGSISREETVDTVGFRLCSIALEGDLAKESSSRDKWRAFSIISQSLTWIQTPALEERFEELVAYLEKSADVYNPAVYTLNPLLSTSHQDTDEPAALKATEIYRCVCAMRAIVEAGSQLEERLDKLVLNFAKTLVEGIDTLVEHLSSGKTVGSEKCDMPQYSLHRGTGWLLWSLVRCLFVEYPIILTLLPKLQGEGTFRHLIQTIYWASSASYRMEGKCSTIPWFAHNPKAFPDLWNSVLNNELILSSPHVTSGLVDVMLQGDKEGNPLLTSTALDTFAVRSLLQTPLELLSKKDREAIAIKWAPTPDMISKSPPTQDLGPKGEPPQTNIPALDPAVLSLQVKIMHRPTFYENMNYQDLVTLAESFEKGCIVSHKATLSIFEELVKLTITQMTSNPDQARTKEYLTGTLNLIKCTVKSVDNKKKGKKWTYALIALFDSTLAVLRPKLKILVDADIISDSKFHKLLDGLKDSLLDYFGTTMQKLAERLSEGRICTNRSMSLLCLFDALPNLCATSSELATFKDAAKKLTAFDEFMTDRGLETGKRLETFLAAYGEGSKEEIFGDKIRGDVSTLYGRQSIIERSKAAVVGKDQAGKLKLLNFVLDEGSLSLTQLDKLLAARQVVMSLEDTRKRSEEDDEDENDDFDMSTAYATLCGHLWKAKELRQFCLISETMVLMLRTKGRCISQWNVDSTLGAITIICSRNGPSLRSNRAGTIYLHLCNLMQAVLTSHRLKLQGHFHLVVQVMQALLRCLFIPLRHSTTKTTKFMAPPPWLFSPKHQLTAKDAVAYTRLITLISDPSVSSVTRSQHNSLTSAIAKAKGMAAQHMQFVLTTYIRLQLEMRMLPEIREKMVPGLYAIFDTTTPEMRRMINDSLDSSGRSVFTTLFRDYQRFGKWKGS